MKDLKLRSDQLIFGTMRLNAYSENLADWASVLDQLQELKIHRLHVSSEYETFEALAPLIQKRSDFSVVVKLGEPHFSDLEFSAQRLYDKIDAYRQALNVEQIDTLQWMWRANLAEDDQRIKNFNHQWVHIAEAFDVIKNRGWVRRLVCFPYSVTFLTDCLVKKDIDGFAVYLNPQEQDYADSIQRCFSYKKEVMVIRPFGAGESFQKGYDMASLLRLPFQYDAVTDVVFTATQMKHLSELSACLV